MGSLWSEYNERIADMWKTRPEPEAEIDIENLPVKSIDRRGPQTVVSFTNHLCDDYLRCSLAQHQKFVDRLRFKLHLSGK